MPGRMLVQGLSNTKDNGGVTGSRSTATAASSSTCSPCEGQGRRRLRLRPRHQSQKNVMLSSSFTGRANYMRELGKLVGDAEAMKKFGNTMVVWDLKALTPKKVLSVPGAHWRSAGPSMRATTGHHRDRAHLQALAGEAGHGGGVAGQGGSRPSPIRPRSRSGGHQYQPRWHRALGEYLHGRQDPLLRPHQSGAARSRSTKGNRQAGQT